MNRLAVQHALFWLLAGNSVGLWLAALLLFPELNGVSGEFTYGRIVPLHLNFQLYGWTSLPLVLWLFRIFSCEEGTATRSAVIIWSLALAVGGVSWLAGGSSGKIFLEWAGFSRVFFSVALLFLWCVLAAEFARKFPKSALERFAKIAALALLLAVVPVWFWAASPTVYPAVNPHTSGPTAASLLGSTLIVVLLLLIAAPMLGSPKNTGHRTRVAAWAAFGIETLVFGVCDKGNVSHRAVSQMALLGLLLAWAPLLPSYFNSYNFPKASHSWLRSALLWFALLALTGWISFLPKVLDSWKFTNALVAHSHLAMAGFVTAFNLFLLTALAGIETSRATIWTWNAATLAYVISMWISGTFEAVDAGFTIVPSQTRLALYSIRMLAGLALAGCSLHWWLRALGFQPKQTTEMLSAVPAA